MPNNVYNKIIIKSKDKDILAFIKSEKSLFDFNNFIHLPEALKIRTEYISKVVYTYELTKSNAIELLPEEELVLQTALLNIEDSWYDQTIEPQKLSKQLANTKEIKALAKHLYSNYLNFGSATWYQWSIKNWGTMQNAYEVSVQDNEICFQTAWDIPKPIIDKLIEKFQPSMIYKGIEENESFWFIKEYQDGILIKDRHMFESDRTALSIELMGFNPNKKEEGDLWELKNVKENKKDNLFRSIRRLLRMKI